MAKLFLGGLSPQTTEDSIRMYFGRFGTITDAVAMKGPDGRPRCFGFVSFQEPGAADQVIAAGRHDLDGSSVEIKLANGKPEAPSGPRADMGIYADPGWPTSQYNQPPQFQQFQENQLNQPQQYQQFQESQLNQPPQYQQQFQMQEYAPSPQAMQPPPSMQPPQNFSKQVKLFLGGISKATTTEGLKAYFGQFGEITDAVAMMDAVGMPRCFGFVTFADAQVADSVLNGSHELDGKWLDIKPTTKEGSKGKGGKGGGGKQKFGQGYGKGCGDFGKGGYAPMWGKGYDDTDMTGQYGKGWPSSQPYAVQNF